MGKGFHTINLNIGDFLGGVVGWDAQEVGAYTLLIIAHYQSGMGGLSADDKSLARIARVSSTIWKRLKPIISQKFDLVEENIDGVIHVYWVNERCVKELQKSEKVSKQNSLNALKRHNKHNATAQRKQSDGDAIQNPQAKIKNQNTQHPFLKKEEVDDVISNALRKFDDE